jgi:hypothetical protein
VSWELGRLPADWVDEPLQSAHQAVLDALSLQLVEGHRPTGDCQLNRRARGEGRLRVWPTNTYVLRPRPAAR